MYQQKEVLWKNCSDEKIKGIGIDVINPKANDEQPSIITQQNHP